MAILAVDPRPDNLKLLISCIEANHPGEAIHSFTDPMLAYKFGVNNPVQSVYTVINMRRMTGFELVKLLRKRYPQILTNYIDQNDYFRRDAKRLAAYTYVIEPVTVELMRQAEAEAELYAKGDEEIEDG